MAKENVDHDEVDMLDGLGQIEGLDGVRVTLDPAEH